VIALGRRALLVQRVALALFVVVGIAGLVR